MYATPEFDGQWPIVFSFSNTTPHFGQDILVYGTRVDRDIETGERLLRNTGWFFAPDFEGDSFYDEEDDEEELEAFVGCISIDVDTIVLPLFWMEMPPIVTNVDELKGILEL